MSSHNTGVHITPPDDGRWNVIRDRAHRALSVHNTQDATSVGRDTARRDQIERYIHGRDGKVRDRDSSGNDPYPPRG